MTEAIQTICLVEGMPLNAPPSLVMKSARIRYERRRQDKIDISMATANLILGGFSSTSDTLDAVAHMFTEDEIEQIREEREERQQLAYQQAQLAMLRVKYDRRGNDKATDGSGRH